MNKEKLLRIINNHIGNKFVFDEDNGTTSCPKALDEIIFKYRKLYGVEDVNRKRKANDTI
jgi:hypothetical protein